MCMYSKTTTVYLFLAASAALAASHITTVVIIFNFFLGLLCFGHFKLKLNMKYKCYCW